MLWVVRVKTRNTFKNNTAYGAEYVGLYTMSIIYMDTLCHDSVTAVKASNVYLNNFLLLLSKE